MGSGKCVKKCVFLRQRPRRPCPIDAVPRRRTQGYDFSPRSSASEGCRCAPTQKQIDDYQVCVILPVYTGTWLVVRIYGYCHGVNTVVILLLILILLILYKQLVHSGTRHGVYMIWYCTWTGSGFRGFGTLIPTLIQQARVEELVEDHYVPFYIWYNICVRKAWMMTDWADWAQLFFPPFCGNLLQVPRPALAFSSRRWRVRIAPLLCLKHNKKSTL